MRYPKIREWKHSNWCIVCDQNVIYWSSSLFVIHVWSTFLKLKKENIVKTECPHFVLNILFICPAGKKQNKKKHSHSWVIPHGIAWWTSVTECTGNWCFNLTYHENLPSLAYIQIKIHPGFKGNWRCGLLGLCACWELLCINLSEDLICIQIRRKAPGTLVWNSCVCDL